jgi:hypothetical protein
MAFKHPVSSDLQAAIDAGAFPDGDPLSAINLEARLLAIEEALDQIASVLAAGGIAPSP